MQVVALGGACWSSCFPDSSFIDKFRPQMNLFNPRLHALIQKEFGQIRRDRRVAMSLILPPVLRLLLFGFVLNSKVQNLRLGVIDASRTVATSWRSSAWLGRWAMRWKICRTS
jgi:hypothetical protein